MCRITQEGRDRVREARAAMIANGTPLPEPRPRGAWGDTGRGLCGAFIDVNARYETKVA